MGLPLLNLFNLFKPIPNLNKCVCGSDDITTIEVSTISNIGISAVIKCKKCNREIRRRTYKRAVKAWNRNNMIGGDMQE